MTLFTKQQHLRLMSVKLIVRGTLVVLMLYAAFVFYNHTSIDTPRILLLITTHFSDRHIRYFDCCWPRLMEQSKLLRMVHVLLFTNNPLESYDTNVAQRIRALFANNPSVAYKHAPLDTIAELQVGANLPMKLGFEENWFRDYDWVIRINPDVLIRNSTFLLDAMKQYKLDAILHRCTPNKIHTDFMAFRPTALNVSLPFSELVGNNHELTAAKAFKSIIDNNRYSQVIDAVRSRGFCRIRGPNSSVFHYHNSCNHGDLVCHALEEWKIS